MSGDETARAYRWVEVAKDQPMALLERQRIVGERVMLSRVVLKQGCVVPMHQHENEQFACLVSGRLRFEIGAPGSDGARTLTAEGGDVVHFPSNVPHAAEALEDTVVIDVFSPPSETTGIDNTGRSGAQR
jgi:quercetin dioxygenase-like cupin family protein